MRWFLDADDNTDSHQNLIITFWSICTLKFVYKLIPFRGICIKSTN